MDTPAEIGSTNNDFPKSRLITLARIFGSLVGLIALLVGTGWWLAVPLLQRWLPDHPAMRPSAALAFLLLSASLLVRLRTSRSTLADWISVLLAWLAVLVACLAGSDNELVRVGFEASITSLVTWGGINPSVDPTTRGGWTPFFYGIALLLFSKRGPKSVAAFQALVILPVFAALLAIIGHLYNVPSFYGSQDVPLKMVVSFPGAVSSVVFGLALFAGRPELETTKMVVSKTVGGYVARRLLLAPVMIPMLTGLIQVVGIRFGHYNPGVANWLFSFSNILVFTVVIAWIALLLYRTDLTRQTAEETVLRLKDGLEEQVRRRTDELTGTNLRLEREMEERKATEQQLLRSQRVECLGALAGGIAHDLNNMLSPIMMVTELIDPALKDAEAKRHLRTISQCAERGSNLIRQIMVFARGSEGGMQGMDLTVLLRDLDETLAATMSRAVDLKVVFPRDLPLIHADPTQIHQVLMNLCINARDAMPEGGALRMEAGIDPVDPTRIEIKVSDTGTGIPAEALLRIFDPFFSTKAPGRGTGLGLATVKRIVETHHGTIGVESTVGKGTTFVVRFPVAARDSEPSRLIEAPQHLGSGQHLLVVEDELALREILKATLENAGYRVTVAPDGVEALKAVRSNGSSIDLVLTDFEMPFMGGQRLSDELAKHRPLLTVILMSGSLDLDDPPGSVATGTWHLAKPFTVQSLLETVHGALAKLGRHPSPSNQPDCPKDRIVA